MLLRAGKRATTFHTGGPRRIRLLPVWILALHLVLIGSAAQAADAKKKDESAKKEKAKTSDSASSAKKAPAKKASTEKAPAEKAPAKKPKKSKAQPASSTAGLRPGEAARWMFFVDGGIRSDSGRMKGVDVIGDNRDEDERFNRDIKAFGPLFHFGFLKKLGKSVGVGAAFGYGVNYNVTERLTKEQRQNDEEPDRWQMGQLLSLDARFEWSGHVTDKVAIAITPLAGITTIIPGGDLQEETDMWKGSHNIGPRLGFVVGGDLGLRYYVTRWFSFKGGVGFNYFVQQLLTAKRRGETTDSKHTWKISASRLTAGLALEASF